MEDFLSEITDDVVRARNQKLKNMLKLQHQEIIDKIVQHTQYILSIKKTKSGGHNFEEVQQCYQLFQKACQNILNTYFPLIEDEDFLSLQSQQQLEDKVTFIKTVIDRHSANLIKRLNRPKQELVKQKKIKKQAKGKGKNSKIPVQSTCIMQKWLLQNFHDPYPTQLKKQQMARQSKLTVYQVNNWFINARQRVIKRFLKKEGVGMQKKTSSQSQSEMDQQNLNSSSKK